MRIFQKIEIGFLLFLISGCTITLGTKKQKESTYTYHYVRKGENLFRISKYYYEGETVEEIKDGIEKIKKANDMEDERIYVGQKLIIPDTKKKQPDYALLPPETLYPPSQQIQKPTDLVKTPIIKDTTFIWPVEGEIICKFNELGNKGIDLMVEPGSEIIASAEGEVVFVGDTRKYGEAIILKHSSSVYTVYAHDLEIKVKNGDKVKQGQILAKVKSGTQRKRYIHFEIIIDGVNVDPLIYLPEINDGKTNKN